jgi:hypothetical protein
MRTRRHDPKPSRLRPRRRHRRIFDDDGPFSDLFDEREALEGCPMSEHETPTAAP